MLPALALSWPILNFVNLNRVQLSGDSVIRIAAYGLVGVLVLWAIGRVVVRYMPDRLACRFSMTFAVLVALFFFYDAIKAWLEASFPILGPLGSGIAYLGIVLGFAIVTWLFAGRDYVVRLGFVFLLTAIAIPGVSLAFDMLASTQNMERQSAAVASAVRKPNVYVFVSDGYARQDVLARYYGFDNGLLLNALGELGYSVRKDSAANYNTTYLSLASLLEMDYVVTPESQRYVDRLRFTRIITGYSDVVRRFRKHGYAIGQETAYLSGGGCAGAEDWCLDGRSAAWIGQAENGLLHLTPLRGPTRRLMIEVLVETLSDVLPRVEALPGNRPYFLFIHTLPPHPLYPPFVIDSSCQRHTTGALEAGRSEWNNRRAYLDAIRCVNSTILDTAQTLAKRDPNAIVVFLSDHGSASTADVGRSILEWDESQLAERFSNLLVMRMPKACSQLSGAARTLVNVMEVVFACIEDRQPSLKPDRIFSGSYEDDTAFGTVREVALRILDEGFQSTGEANPIRAPRSR